MLDPAVLEFYDLYDEDSRLRTPAGQFEFARTLDILARHLPPPPARILDIGGATGPYSEALAAQGYETHLLDPIAHHIDVARSRTGIASATQGDARRLPWSGSQADAILLMGPLYHLADPAARQAALLEARRVLKRGGILAAAAIGRFTAFLDGLNRGFIDDPLFQPILLRTIDSGIHENDSGDPSYFTSAHYHLPEELRAEIQRGGFVNPTIFAVEGPAYIAPDLEARWRDPARRAFLLEVLRRLEREETLLGASQHLLAIARKP
ncbi:class I SAM-dependent methyltransferase [uncultured Paludibaculum sp.]|uniref:class I SAM-dependent methyltransferase n=1 Tax=uncultured Paludibaculum sp. TaxID=1765020 RepID=UPI002AAB793A|nr:class I SAM-dependent methyltransferase [uncultured Paludibaculum sp.]